MHTQCLRCHSVAQMPCCWCELMLWLRRERVKQSIPLVFKYQHSSSTHGRVSIHCLCAPVGLLSPTERCHSQAGNGRNFPCFFQIPNAGPLLSSTTNKHRERCMAWTFISGCQEGKTKEVWNATGLLSSSMTRVFKGRECFDLWAVEEAWPDRDCFKYLWPLLTNISTAIYSQGGSGKQS